MVDHPRLPIHYLLKPDFGVSPDVTLRILSGDGKVEGELKAHGVILALGSSVLKEILFSKSGELISWSRCGDMLGKLFPLMQVVRD